MAITLVVNKIFPGLLHSLLSTHVTEIEMDTVVGRTVKGWLRMGVRDLTVSPARA